MLKVLLTRDIKLAVRSGSGVWLSLMFFLLVTCLLAFAIGPQDDLMRSAALPFLWVGVFLSALLSLDRMFSYDFEDGTLARIVTSPIPIEAVVLVKVLVHWAGTGVPLAIAAPFLGTLFGVPMETGINAGISLLVGTVAASAIGSFGAAISVVQRRGNLLLAAMVLPLFVPTLVFGTRAMSPYSTGDEAASTAILMLVAISLAALAMMPLVSARVLLAHIRN